MQKLLTLIPLPNTEYNTGMFCLFMYILTYPGYIREGARHKFEPSKKKEKLLHELEIRRALRALDTYIVVNLHNLLRQVLNTQILHFNP